MRVSRSTTRMCPALLVAAGIVWGSPAEAQFDRSRAGALAGDAEDFRPGETGPARHGAAGPMLKDNGKSPAAPAQAADDVLSQLLQEVRQLRIAMERAATTAPRIQLLTSRLSMQEARVTRLARELDDLRRELSRVIDVQARAAERAGNAEEALQRETDPPARQELAQHMKSLKAEARSAAAEEQRLRQQESELTATLATEQARWIDIDNRLDELERTLAER